MDAPPIAGPLRTPARRLALIALLVCALIAGLTAPADAVAAGGLPSCFGAAARDRVVPCTNPGLRLTVRPAPEDALIAPNAPCVQATALTAVPFVCAFGARPGETTGETIALLGDSHAAHWRAALDPVARATGRPGLSVTRSSCPYSPLPTLLPEPARSQCLRWVAAIPRWFTAHPEVTTVFISSHAGVRSEIPTGASMFEAQARAYVQAWRRLPATVSQIVVLRDTPTNRTTTNDCIERAVARRRRAGIVCALPRRRILHRDPAATAARRLRSPRVEVVDLTSYLCSTRLCFPVIGGALVHKDIDHLTDVFARTLAPYLQRRLAQLLPAWGRRSTSRRLASPFRPGPSVVA